MLQALNVNPFLVLACPSWDLLQFLWKVIQKNTQKVGSPQSLRLLEEIFNKNLINFFCYLFATITACWILQTANYLKTYSNQQ